MNEVIDMFSLTFQLKKLEFIVEPKGEIPHKVVTDERRLKQVLINLLSNAQKFTIKGSVSILYQFNQNDKSLKFTVEDTGSGIKKAD